MARPKKPGVARHLHIDPYVWVKEEDRSKTVDENMRVDKFLAWFDSQPAGQRTAMCLELIVAAVNGELGVASTVAIGTEDDGRAQAALEGLLKNMVMDED